MARDDRIRAVIERWAPRFTANGVPLHDFQTVTGALESWDNWCRAWSDRAAEHEAAGRAALAGGNHVTAAQYLKTAGVLYHFAKFVFIEDMDQLKAAHDKALECYNLALPLLDPPGERIGIPYGGHTLHGNLRKPMGVAKPPVVVMCVGMDSTKEEMATNEADFLARGLATLAFDGPGQGEAEYDLPIEPEYEKPVSAVIDAIAARDELSDDLDAGHVGVWGVSFGGYYAPRAAAFDDRIKACAAISGPFDFGALFRAGNLNAVFTVRAHAENEEAARAVADRITLEGVAERIACPLFVVGGALDRIAPPAEQERLAAEASGETELLMLEGGIHCGHNLRHKYSPHVADWMAAKLS